MLNDILTDKVIEDLKTTIGNMNKLSARSTETLDKVDSLLDSSQEDIKQLLAMTQQATDDFSKLSDNKHRITSILELNKNAKGEIVLKEIFTFKTKGILKNGLVDGEFELYNYLPRSYKKIKALGIDLVDDIFENIK